MSNINVWNAENLKSKILYRHFPTDMMLRALVSDSYFERINVKNSGVVLDIGCLYANNLVPFFERGFDCFGTEVTEESVEICRDSAKKQNIDAKIELGFNNKLPYEKNKFDLVLSMATIHYEESVEDVCLALAEFKRVLKPDGSVLIQTVAPNHSIFQNSKLISDNLYRLEDVKDIRNGQKFTFFDRQDVLFELLSEFFRDVEIARCTEEYPKHCVDIWLAKCGN